MASRLKTLTLFSSSTCSLCTTAKESILKVQKQQPFKLVVLDIHKEECPKEFSDKYMFDIPVVHLNDQFLTQHRVQEDKLSEALKKYDQTGLVEKIK
ncbi:thioredoxin-like protein [Phascolomyces articulosus]|uniref:Glutaredoxin-like protein n=1 Tax=Phascolomyces articulosus TaxID=60185 RepID=A0AAD5PBD7_9FUNG|nr:thioredoxin-like protein [Phascolomyces articulosus]